MKKIIRRIGDEIANVGFVLLFAFFAYAWASQDDVPRETLIHRLKIYFMAKPKSKQILDVSAIITGIALTLFTVIAFFMQTNNTFWIEYGKVHISPHMAHDAVPGFVKFLTWFFVVAVWAAIIVVYNDWHEGKRSVDSSADPKNGLGVILIAAPTLIAVIFCMAWYNGKVDNNFVTVYQDRLDSWKTTGVIKEGGKDHYHDNADTLKNLFRYKPMIK